MMMAPDPDSDLLPEYYRLDEPNDDYTDFESVNSFETSDAAYTTAAQR